MSQDGKNKRVEIAEKVSEMESGERQNINDHFLTNLPVEMSPVHFIGVVILEYQSIGRKWAEVGYDVILG